LWLWQQQLQIIEDTAMPITICTRDEEEKDSVGLFCGGEIVIMLLLRE
jgi:hypothetical protein